MAILSISLWLNVLVLTPLVAIMVVSNRWTIRVFGQATPARAIVLAHNLAFLATSMLFLVWPLEPGIITLLAIQIASGVLTAFTLRALTSPVVIGSLLLAALQTGLLVLHSMPS